MANNTLVKKEKKETSKALTFIMCIVGWVIGSFLYAFVKRLITGGSIWDTFTVDYIIVFSCLGLASAALLAFKPFKKKDTQQQN